MQDVDKYGTKTIQSELLKMIKNIDNILTKNNVHYSLSGGSVLGAIRHGGFIPWDDDIDIMVERKYLDSAIDAINASKEYYVIRDLWLHRIKLKNDDSKSSVAVDIFVADNCPNNNLTWRLKIFMLRILQGMLHDKPDYSKYSFAYKICIFLTYQFGKLFSYDTKFKWYTRVAQIGNKKKTQFIEFPEDLFKSLNLRYDGDLMENLVLHKFENTELPIVSKYDSYLTTLYGDYMKLPDEKDRVPQHMRFM